jgi:hypothetical protein
MTWGKEPTEEERARAEAGRLQRKEFQARHRAAELFDIAEDLRYSDDEVAAKLGERMKQALVGLLSALGRKVDIEMGCPAEDGRLARFADDVKP